LFIYASTVVKFVASRYHQPPKRLNLLVSLPQNTAREGEFGINSLYTEILKQAYCDLGPDDQNPDNQEVYCCFRTVVGAVLLAFNPLSMKSLSYLLRDFDTPSDISTALNPLHSLLLVPEGTEDSIHVLHKSFPDFLMDPKRCQDPRFFVDPSVHHMEIVVSCLHLMEERLKRNICNLDDCADLSDANCLSACRREYIGEGLEYACQFWTKHLLKSPSSGPDAEKVQKAIDKFFTTHLLFWIEVLIIMGNLDASVYSINDIQQWYTLVSYEHVFTETYIYLLLRGALSASGQMIASISSWDTLKQSATPFPSYIILHSPFPLLPLGCTSTTLQNCQRHLRQSRELKLNGEHASAQFHLTTTYRPSHTGTIPLQLGLGMGTLSSLMQSLAARQLFFLDIQVE
jgi:hypothetical protein